MRMTKPRKAIIEKMQETPLYFEFTDRGAESYYFGDGTGVSNDIVSGMISAGGLKKSESLLGTGQELLLADN